MDPLYDEVRPDFWYLYAPAANVRKRLEIQGYTAQLCRKLWEHGYREHLESIERMALTYEEHGLTEELAACRSWTYDSWQEDYFRSASTRSIDALLGPSGMLRYEISDPFACLAIQIDALQPQAVWMDLTDLYEGEFDASVSLTTNLAKRYSDDREEDGPIGKILILTEGKSDSKLLAAALAALYPEFCDIYDFVDFEGFKIEGGASPLARMVKAFAGVKQQIRILAVFDNDAAGHEAMMSLSRVQFPRNIRLMTLPDIPFARRYPTIGPEGLRPMDVNGSACSIELFLGKEALVIADRALSPVRWSQWNARAERYQGELDRKDAVATKFLELLQSGDSPRRLRKRFPEMHQLLQSIFRAFAPAT
ncbi:hypothetical protein SPH9361_04042 [Sphingobium sp. CECT 9361]|nr:hypothetical protein SPH9361_04042 [Sphingobium sp. CECT 9361]